MRNQSTQLTIAFLLATGLSFATSTLVLTGIDTATGLGTATGSNGWLDVGGTDQDLYWFGGLDITVDGTARTVFCIDLFTDIYLGSTNSSTLTYPDSAAQGQAAWLLNQYWPDTATPPTVVIGGIPTMATSAQVGAAIQLALWDLVENDGAPLTTNSPNVGLSVDDSSAGTVATDPVVANLAESFIESSAGQSSSNAFVYNNFCTSGAPVCNTGSQTLIGLAVNDGGPVPSVPEIGTIWMCAAGGILVWFGSYWKKRYGRVSHA